MLDFSFFFYLVKTCKRVRRRMTAGESVSNLSSLYLLTLDLWGDEYLCDHELK